MPAVLARSSARPRAARRRSATVVTGAFALACLLPLAGLASAHADDPADAAAQDYEAEAAAYRTPTFVRAIGARGSAGLYAWGAAYNPVTNEVLAGDYLNYQVRRYTSGGSSLGSFYRPPSDRRGQPEGIAVDPRDGSIYVSDHSRDNAGYVAKFSKSGTFIREYKLTARYHAWMAMDPDGYLYVSDSHSFNTSSNPPQIRKYRLSDTSSTVTEVDHWGTYGWQEGQIRWITGLAVDPTTRRVFVADTAYKRVLVYDADGTYRMTIGEGSFKGDLRGVAINPSTRQLYVVDANAGQVKRFNADTGALMSSFGSLGHGTGQFGDGARQITIDGSGNVWAADYGNTRMLKFTSTGTFIGAYPNPAQDAPAGAFSSPRDVAVSAKSRGIYVVEQNNHRIQRMNPDGSFKKVWGGRSSSVPLGFNYPRGLALQPGSERVWVANTTSSAVRILSPFFGKVKDISGFSEPVDIEFGNGKAYVGDANGGFVRILNATSGATEGNLRVRASGVAVDPATGDIFVTSWYDDRVYHYTANGQQGSPAVIGSKGTGRGQFVNPWDIDIVGGLLYITDSDRNVVIVYGRDGSLVGEFGSTGSRAGQFRNPSGLTHDGTGKLYIADTGNDRVQVFDTKGWVKADGTRPSVSIGSPANRELVGLPVTLTGSVTDNLRNGTVEVSVQDLSTYLWWDGRTATWSKTKMWTNGGIKGGNVKSGRWWFPLIGAEKRRTYSVAVRSYDAAGNVSSIAYSTFSTTG